MPGLFLQQLLQLLLATELRGFRKRRLLAMRTLCWFAITWTSSPSCSAKVVRKISCRSTKTLKSPLECILRQRSRQADRRAHVKFWTADGSSLARSQKRSCTTLAGSV